MDKNCIIKIVENQIREKKSKDNDNRETKSVVKLFCIKESGELILASTTFAIGPTHLRYL